MKIPALTKTYEGRTVLDTPEITLERGKIYALIGANGSGKSTFARILSAVEKADNKKPCEITDDKETHVSVGYMPQKNFAFKTTVLKNIMLADNNQARAESFIERFRLTELKDKSAKKLSGGETAKVAAARIMMGHFDLLILDEPSQAMDMESAKVLEELIGEYVKEHNCALILITHSLREARRTADEIIFLSEGRLIEKGPVAEILAGPENSLTQEFLDFYG
ncbi:MAG: ABC transporter ATP-binding protein [Parasporobacterium sp.]|nr:ABC transporter ATP-binding protein [Parasporobacterium sp.]